jgi:hypothetical protein
MKQAPYSTAAPIAQKKKSPLPIILAVILVLGLAAGGWFFRENIAALFAADDTSDIASTEETASTTFPASAIPTDANGVNLMGNHMENLQQGGLLTMQGELTFFANMSDGGTLYVMDRAATVSAKLTEFPVANLNLIGDRLVFTDISDSGYVSDSGFTPLGGDTALGVALAAPENALLRFGGVLYALDGVLSLPADLSGTDILILTPLLEGVTVQSPLWNGGEITAILREETGGDIAPVAAMPDDSLTIAPLVLVPGTSPQLMTMATQPAQIEQPPYRVVRIDENGVINTTGLTSEAYPHLLSLLVYGDTAYAELASAGEGDHIIIKYDFAGNTVTATMPGDNLRAAGDLVVFRNPADKLLYDLNPETEEIGLVSNVLCPDGFAIVGAGNILFTVPKTGGTAHITISREATMTDDDGKAILPASEMRGWYTYVDLPEILYILPHRTGDDYHGYMPDGGIFSEGDRVKIKIPPGGGSGGGGGGQTPGGNTGGGGGQTPGGNTGGGGGQTPGGDNTGGGSDEPPGGGSSGGNQRIPLQPVTSGDAASLERAFRAHVRMFMGHDYDDPVIKAAYTYEQFSALSARYGEDMQIGNKIAEGFTSEMTSQLGQYSANAAAYGESFWEGMQAAMEFSEFTVTSAELDDSFTEYTGYISGKVDYTSTARLDIQKLPDSLTGIYMNAIQEYPGGQPAIVAQGEQFFVDWFFGILKDAISSPEEYELMSYQQFDNAITFNWDNTTGWYTEVFENVGGVVMVGE